MILFDFLTFEDPYINGGMLYTFSVLRHLCKKTKRIVGVCSDPEKIHPYIRKFIDENRVKIACLTQGLDKIVEENKIDVFFIGIAQRYNGFDLTSLPCSIVVVCHDVSEVSLYYAGPYYDLDQRAFFASLHSKHPFLSRVKFILSNFHRFKSLYGIKAEPKALENGLGYGWFAKLLARPNCHVVTVSEYSKTSLQYYFDKIANPIEVFFPTSCQIETTNGEATAGAFPTISKPYFLALGADRFNKNTYTVIKAFERFNRFHGNAYELVVVGKTKRPISQEGVIQVGQVNPNVLGDLYEKALAFVYPSFGEGFGLPPLEAMSHRVPVLASYTTSIPEVCGDSVLYFNPFYREDLFSALNAVLDEKVRREYIEKGLKRKETLEKKIEDDTDRLIRFILEKTNGNS